MRLEKGSRCSSCAWAICASGHERPLRLSLRESTSLLLPLRGGKVQPGYIRRARNPPARPLRFGVHRHAEFLIALGLQSSVTLLGEPAGAYSTSSAGACRNSLRGLGIVFGIALCPWRYMTPRLYWAPASHPARSVGLGAKPRITASASCLRYASEVAVDSLRASRRDRRYPGSPRAASTPARPSLAKPLGLCLGIA